MTLAPAFGTFCTAPDPTALASLMSVTSSLSHSHLHESSPDLSTGTRIDLDDLAKRYVVGGTTVTALSEVNLHVDETAFVVVLGPSGSGKTTLLNMIGLLD